MIKRILNALGLHIETIQPKTKKPKTHRQIEEEKSNLWNRKFEILNKKFAKPYPNDQVKEQSMSLLLEDLERQGLTPDFIKRDKDGLNFMYKSKRALTQIEEIILDSQLRDYSYVFGDEPLVSEIEYLFSKNRSYERVKNNTEYQNKYPLIIQFLTVSETEEKRYSELTSKLREIDKILENYNENN